MHQPDCRESCKLNLHPETCMHQAEAEGRRGRGCGRRRWYCGSVESVDGANTMITIPQSCQSELRGAHRAHVTESQGVLLWSRSSHNAPYHLLPLPAPAAPDLATHTTWIYTHPTFLQLLRSSEIATVQEDVTPTNCSSNCSSSTIQAATAKFCANVASLSGFYAFQMASIDQCSFQNYQLKSLVEGCN